MVVEVPIMIGYPVFDSTHDAILSARPPVNPIADAIPIKVLPAPRVPLKSRLLPAGAAQGSAG